MEKFSYETNGYNREEVNQFVSVTQQETENIIQRAKEQEEVIDSLNKEVSKYREMEQQLRLALKEIEEERKVKQETNEIIENAKKDASIIINDALERAKQIEQQRELLERNMKKFKRKLRLIIDQQQVIADKIDELEIDDK